ncbi:MAG: hypothetical protein QOD07_2424 [Frankiaceae bacterium]|nr:hypothetical protein [Frankiaceae bacterium]
MSRRRFVVAAVLGTTVLGATVVTAVPTFGAVPSLPYRDPAVHGGIAFCDQHDHPVTSGSLEAQPFVWKALSSVAAPAGYTGAQAKVTLLAFQPREGVDPSDWSGNQLTASSTFTNRAHPAAQSTYGDQPLVSFVQAFPPKWDGLIQLRMYFSVAGSSPYSRTYPAADIRVSGDRWTLVDGARVDCGAGRGMSSETVLLPKSRLASPAPVVVHTPAPTASATAGARGGQPSSPSGGAVAESAGTRAAGSSPLPTALIAVVVALAAGGGGVVLWRRRSRTPTPTSAPR